MRVALVLGVAVLAVSGAGTLVRLVPDLHPIAIAFWRVLFVAIVLAPWARRLDRRDAVLVGLAGLCLALHFWVWFASLTRTSVMRSTLLVCLTPIWAGLGEQFLGERRPTRFWVGILVAIAGVTGMAAGGGEATLTGDALATLGGVFGAAYFVIGRDTRRRVGIGAYGFAICLATAIWLLPFGVGAGASFAGWQAEAWLVLAALAAGPQLLGHIGFNYAVGYLPAAVVAAVILLEPIGATLVAGGVLGEVPSTRELSGGVTVIAGVAVATVPRWRLPRFR